MTASPSSPLLSSYDEFLETHHRSGLMPVPIEWIAENEFGMTIIPIPGLDQRIGSEAFITDDMKEIHIDEAILLNFGRRYRFTLAHELGHVIRSASSGNGV